MAIDIAVLPPPEVSSLAIELSAALPEAESEGLRLGANTLPHVTLTQQFIRESDLGTALDRIGALFGALGPMRLTISGGGKGRSSVWMAVEAVPALVALHVELMAILEPFERPEGTPAAFFDGDARSRDVAWVAGYRRESSFASFTPHITLGHAAAPPLVKPLSFEATTIAACHLGRFCTCRRVLRGWTLTP